MGALMSGRKSRLRVTRATRREVALWLLAIVAFVVLFQFCSAPDYDMPPPICGEPRAAFAPTCVEPPAGRVPE